MSGFTPEGMGLGGAHMSDRGRLVGAAVKVKPWHRRRAVRTCAHNAADSAEFVELIAMLGLSAEEGR